VEESFPETRVGGGEKESACKEGPTGGGRGGITEGISSCKGNEKTE